MKVCAHYLLFTLLLAMPVHGMEVDNDNDVDELLYPKIIRKCSNKYEINKMEELGYQEPRQKKRTKAIEKTNDPALANGTKIYDPFSGGKETYNPKEKSYARLYMMTEMIEIRSTEDDGLMTRWFSSEESSPWKIAYHPDGQSLAIGHYGGKIEIRSAKNGKLISQWDSKSVPWLLTYAPDGNFIAIAHHEQVEIYATKNGDFVTRWDSGAIWEDGSRAHKLIYHTDGNSLGVEVVANVNFPKDKKTMEIRNILPVLAAYTCRKHSLTTKQSHMLKKLHDNTTNKPLYLKVDEKNTFDSLCGTGDDNKKRKPGIDDFYTLQKLKCNDTETDETKKRWQIVPKTFDPQKLEQNGKSEDE